MQKINNEYIAISEMVRTPVAKSRGQGAIGMKKKVKAYERKGRKDIAIDLVPNDKSWEVGHPL
jgi:hypothetical protein